MIRLSASRLAAFARPYKRTHACAGDCAGQYARPSLFAVVQVTSNRLTLTLTKLSSISAPCEVVVLIFGTLFFLASAVEKHRGAAGTGDHRETTPQTHRAYGVVSPGQDELKINELGQDETLRAPS
jgi:hypothetical protein